MIKTFVKILEMLGDRLEVCVSVYARNILKISYKSLEAAFFALFLFERVKVL